MIGSHIYSVLSGATAVTAIVSTRIYPVVIPQTKDLPAIVYSIGSADPSHTNSGARTLDKFQFQLICISRKYSDVDDLAAKCRTALHGYKTTTVQEIRYQTEMDDFDVEVMAYLRIMTFNMRIKV